MKTVRLSARGVLAALVVGLVTFAHGPSAEAGPIISDLALVRSDATTIVLGTVRWITVPTPGTSNPKPALVIAVDATVRGSAPAVLPVVEPPEGHVTVDGERVVAFVDAKNQLRWIGRKLAGPDLEHGVLQLSGFFDFNAHVVRPGMMTLAQLRAYLATGAMKTPIAATIAFPDGHGGTRASARHFTVDWDPFARTGTVSGFAPACLAFTTIFGMEWGKIELVFSDTCNYGSKSRSLTLQGTPTGADATGALTVDVLPTAPLLEESEFDPYVNDGHVADVVRVVRVGLPDGSAWSWRIGDALVDPAGKAHAPGGTGSSMSDKATATGHVTVTESYWTFGDATVRLARTSTGATSAPSLGSDHEVIAAVDAGGWSCTFTRGAGAALPCTLRRAPPVMVRR
jgi:hypothetical protein